MLFDNIYELKYKTMYCKCGDKVHPYRLNLGYKTCPSCSEIKKHSYVPITYHKTGNTIQIVSQELSDLVHKSQRRR